MTPRVLPPLQIHYRGAVVACSPCAELAYAHARRLGPGASVWSGDVLLARCGLTAPPSLRRTLPLPALPWRRGRA